MSTKYFFYLFFFLFSYGKIFAQSNWPWSKDATTTFSGVNLGLSVSTDTFGNVFITGEFRTNITFGSFTLMNADQSGVGYDFFLTKYDSSGQVLWAKRAGDTPMDGGFSVSTDLNGNAIVTGTFASSSITFGSFTLTNNSAGNEDIFVVKYDTNGNVLWAKNAGGAISDQVHSISVDTMGNSFVTGDFLSATMAFGSTIIPGPGMFIAKYDPMGNILWAKSVLSTNGLRNIGLSVSADKTGNAFVTGEFKSSTIIFDNDTLSNASNNGNRDIFLVKYDGVGNVLWAKNAIGGLLDESSFSVSTDPAGNAFITGYFASDTLFFDAIMLTNNNGLNQQAFIAKYEPNGNAIWARSGHSNNAATGYSISADVNGNIYVTGTFNDTIVFGSTILILPWTPPGPMFLLKCDPNGDILCAWDNESGGYAQNAVSADRFGNADCVGNFSNNPFVVGSDTFALTGQVNVFVGKYRCDNNVGYDELNNEQNILIYPNPSAGIFTLNNGNTTGEIFIYNPLGEIVFQSKVISSTSTLDLSSQSDGIYFLRFVTDKENYSASLIKN